MNRREMLALAPGALILTGCAGEPVKKAEEKPAEPMTGLKALYGMYSRARTWAPDVRVLSMASIAIVQVKPAPGKLGAWQATFASQSLGKKRSYVYSAADVSTTLRQGVFPETPAGWQDDRRSFLIEAVKTDTDQALETALKHGGAEYAKKNPQLPVLYDLELGRMADTPVWRVIWGESANSSTFAVLVDAMSGQYMTTHH
jgi:hypothetical protein